jgi:hypothetical protein
MADARSNGGPDPICHEDPYPRYPEGEYEVIVMAVKVYPHPSFRGKGRDGVVRPTWKIRLDCRRASDQAPVSGFLNLGNEATPDPRPGSDFRRVWIMANGIAPRKRQVMTRRVFVGKVFRVRIGDTRTDRRGREHPEGAVYSTIKEFLACIGP